VLGAPASLIGSELSVYLAPALRFAPLLSCRVFLMYVPGLGSVHNPAASVIAIAGSFVSLHIHPTPQDV
jgi:hypothetical protein